VVVAENPSTLPPVVIVDDDPNDRYLLCDRLRRAGISNPLKTFERADEAMAFLKDEIATGNAIKPACFLFTDLKMPGYDGLALASWVRAHEQLREIPIAIISGGDEPKDRAKAGKLGASYYTKFPPRDALIALVGHS
jgi:two-component system, response regulator